MRKIKCELCVQRDLLKEGSRFVCQTCGAAYSADQLRRQFDLADQATRRRFMLKPSSPGSCIWP
ncbi:hypothetical protein ACXO18_05925 [Lactobacillus delbrueckii subsp. bulgaricus]